MSLWREIKDQDDVELSKDGKTLDVLYDGDQHGNYYIEIPIEFVKRALAQSEPSQDELWEELEDTCMGYDEGSGGFLVINLAKKRYRITRI